MSRWLLLVVSATLFGYAALAQQATGYDNRDATSSALKQALAEQQQAQQRSNQLEAEANKARNAADRAAHETAALAARIQQAEAGIAAANARIGLIDAQQVAMRERLGHEQEPIVHLTAALQDFSRRPVILALLRPGEVRDVVYLRALMASAVPQVQARTAGLRQQLRQQRQLRAAARQAAASLSAEEAQLARRRQEMAEIETRQRLTARLAGGTASQESERALALAEKASDLNSLIGELDHAGKLRAELAALPGPQMRPTRPGRESGSPIQPGTSTPAAPAASGPPHPYLLPVTGRTVTGFGAPKGAGLSQGITLAPIANAQVVAPAAGRVAFAGPYRGYGQIVIIEHQAGWTSLVTGLASTDVEVGEKLVGGAPIGSAGAKDPAVTLELLHGGKPVNPLAYAR